MNGNIRDGGYGNGILVLMELIEVEIHFIQTVIIIGTVPE